MNTTKVIVGVICTLVAFLVINVTDILGNDFSTFVGRLGIAVLVGIGAVIILTMILDQIQVSREEYVGQVSGKDAMDEQGFPFFSSHKVYYLYLKTSDDKVIFCRCSQEEWESAKHNDTVRFVMDIRESGQIYYYTAIRSFDVE